MQEEEEEEEEEQEQEEEEEPAGGGSGGAWGCVPAAVRRMAALRRFWMGVGSGVDLASLLAEPPRNT